MSKPYQYVVLRCVPRVDREEFVNVGVVVYCQAADFLAAVRHALAFIEGVCRGDASLGDPAAGDRGTRFGFLKAPRSTVVQPGPVHGGLTDDPTAELDRLLGVLVR
jgi:hypothetical protein